MLFDMSVSGVLRDAKSRAVCVLAGVFVLPGCVHSTRRSTTTGRPATPAAAVTVAKPSLRFELLAMANTDQQARLAISAELGTGKAPDPEAMNRISARVKEVDAANLRRLKKIVEENGWPDDAVVGSDGARALFLLVQHADADVAVQEQYLSVLKRANDAGTLSLSRRESFALLTDRVRCNQGRKQLYGTQTNVLDEDGKLTITCKPIEDEAHVDERRAALGLPPLAEYLEVIRKSYQPPK